MQIMVHKYSSIYRSIPMQIINHKISNCISEPIIMAPSEFSLRLHKGNYYLSTVSPTKLIAQLGIAGGFAPPTPSLIILIAASNKDLKISVVRRAPGTPDLGPESRNTVAIADHEAVIDELQSILMELPTEQPSGSEDIYGLDTSIAWQSDDLEWMNGGHQGCDGGESFVTVGEEQKKKFKRAVEIVYEISGARSR